MNKNFRLTMRIDSELNKRIEELVKSGKVRDRTDFGRKAISHYIEFLENEIDFQKIKQAIMIIANKTNTRDEIEKILN